MSDNKKHLIILSAGGTGGHMTPAQALAQDLMSRGYEVKLFTDERGESYAHMFKNVEVTRVPSSGLGQGIWGKIKGVSSIAYGILKAQKLLRSLQPALVVGFGGYPSFPAVYAAQRLKIPTIIHEQNAIIGRANAYLATKATRIALSLPSSQGLEEVDRVRAVITGNPVRAEISALYNEPYPQTGDDGELKLLVFGGSLGAEVFSRIVPGALSRLSAEHKGRLRVVQQCRKKDISKVEKMYEGQNIKADLAEFFEDMPERLKAAHLIIARSGASTVAEVTTAGRPAIFVPYPHHKDNQQKLNAESVADIGGAWVMTENGFTEDALLARIETFLQNPQILFKAAEKARTAGKPDAARKLGNLVTAITSGWGD